MSHYRPKDGKDGIPGTHGKDGERGPMGPQGPKGEPGEDGKDGQDGATGAQGPQGERGERGERGPQGERGPRGLTGGRGEVGPMPEHEWDGTSLRFEEPDGWGEWVNLKGEKGDKGEPGRNGMGGMGPPGPPGPPGSGIIEAGDGIEVVTVGDVTTVSHGDTSSIADFANGFTDGVVMQQIALTYDQYGHAQTVGVLGVDLDLRYVQIADQIASTDDLPEGVTNLYFTDERAQDAVGNNLLDTATVNLTYNDSTGQISADVIATGFHLIGTYAARPAAASANAGFTYYATDVRESYRSSGSAWVVVDGAGNELGYAERTSTFTTTSLTLVDLPGMSITFTAGERPVSINFGATLRNNLSGEFTRLALVLDGSPVAQLLTQSTLYYGLSRQFRPALFTPGSSHVAKLQVLTTAAFGAGTAEVFGDPTDRPYIQVVNC